MTEKVLPNFKARVGGKFGGEKIKWQVQRAEQAERLWPLFQEYGYDFEWAAGSQYFHILKNGGLYRGGVTASEARKILKTIKEMAAV